MSGRHYTDLENEEKETIKKLQAMGFSLHRIKEAALSVGATVNEDSFELIVDILTSDPTEDYDRGNSSGYFLPDDNDSLSESDHKAAQIVLPNPNGGYRIHVQELERIFKHENVARKRVALYSLAGAFRKGKSFMLNLFLLFLWAKKKGESKNWLKSKQKELNKGFGWRGGSERHTQGIWIWDEPFFFDTPHGEVAVFLMDTQGSFDPGCSVKNCSVIFGLSTLISSMQIFNVHGQIQEDTLQHLQLFTEYGKAAKQTKKHTIGKPFQDLMFLIRDWSDTDIPYGLQGGEQVLKTAMEVHLQHEDTRSVRKHIQKCFENLSCCLMPYPGEKVSVRKKNQGCQLRLGDVSDEFLQTVHSLVQTLFSRERIVIKKVNNKEVTGRDLVNITLAYFQVFQSGKMPEVTTVLQATARADLMTLVQQCRDLYTREINEKCAEGFKTDCELRTNHNQCNLKAIEKFNKQQKFGDDELVEKYLTNLTNAIDQEFDRVKATNAVKLEQLKVMIKNEAKKAEKNYTKALKDCCGEGYTDENSLNEIQSLCLEQTMSDFKNQTSKYPPDIVQKKITKLESDLQQAFETFKGNNTRKLDQLKRQIEFESNAALHKYNSTMEKKCSNKFINSRAFDEAHRDARDAAMQLFRRSNVGCNTTEKANEEKNLAAQITEAQKSFLKTNELNENITKAKQDAKDTYVSAMKQVCGEVYVNEETLEQVHLECRRQAEKAFLEAKGISDADNGHNDRGQMDDIINNEFDAIKRENKLLKVRNKYVDESRLEVLQEDAKEIAEEYYCSPNEINEPEDEYTSLKEQLENEIDDCYTRVRKRNTSNKKEVEDVAEGLLQKLKEEYLKYMNELCDGKYVETNELRKGHETFCGEIRRNVENQIQIQEVANQTYLSFLVYAQEKFDEIQTRNENNKPSWLWNLAPVLLDGVTAYITNQNHPKKLLIAATATISKFVTMFGKKDQPEHLTAKSEMSSSVDPEEFQ